MLTTFNVKFSSVWGQQIYLVGNCEELGNGNEKNSIPLSYVNDSLWSTQLNINLVNNPIIQYQYYVINNDGSKFFSAVQYQIPIHPQPDGKIVTIDEWVPSNDAAIPFLTKPFETIFYKRKTAVSKPKKSLPYFRFSIKAPQLESHQVVCMIGNHPRLGNWSTDQPALMTYLEGSFQIDLTITGNDFLIYKYGVYDTKQKIFLHFEDGENRILSLERQKKEHIFINEGLLRIGVKQWRGAGIAIPVFSIKTKTSFGVGEFTDLKALANWCKKIKCKLIQLLPINDTTVSKTNKDSYPYAANSSFALHPLYINLKEIGSLPNEHKLEKLYLKKYRKFNKSETLDYESVIKYKLAYLKELFLADTEFLQNEEFKTFFQANQYWLESYATYSFLRDKYKTVEFSKWSIYADSSQQKWKKLAEPQSKYFTEISFWYFVQFHLHQQLSSAISYCHSIGIALKGDLPIGIGRTSCDAWQHPELFNMDQQAGAPPDDFAVKGQNWGFPTYNWEAMSLNGFDWWKKRFEKMADYFDAFRIDHILGFFRIWSIPMHAIEGILGHFIPAIPVHISEFAQRGIHIDDSHFTKPHFTPEFLHQLFEKNAFSVIETFFDYENGKHIFKADFDTQRKIEQYFLKTTIFGNDIQSKLFDCIADVILFDDVTKGEGFYHFNISMVKTHAYKQLNKYQQDVIYQLFINYFYERQDEFWKKEAYKKLPSLQQSTNMLICGEDLGMVPHCVPGVMQSLSMLSLEVQRMPKASNSKFVNLDLVPYLSVVTPSTHDMSTVRGWWEEDRTNTQFYYNHILEHFGEAPQFCEPWVAKDILKRHLQSNSMLCIFQLQDIMATNTYTRVDNPHKERINLPADPEHYWCYRMPCKVEDLLKQKEWNEELALLIQESDRS